MPNFNPSKLKVQLKLAVTRLRMLRTKKASLNVAQRREIADLLERGKEESARIRVEHVIREDYNMEALEMLEIYCEMLQARFGLLEQVRGLDPSVAEAAHGITYAAQQVMVDELNVVRRELINKLGKEFEADSMQNNKGVVNERLIEKLRVRAPDPKLVVQYLTEIARAFKVNWGDTSADFAVDSALIGTDSQQHVPVLTPQPAVHFPAVPSPAAPAAQPARPAADLEALFPAVPKSEPGGGNGRPRGGGGDDDDMPDFDELSRRFEALKRR